MNVNLHTVESAKLVINAPNSHVSLNLKSLHDLSYIQCASAEIIVGEEFNKARIFDQKAGKEYREDLGLGDSVPMLKVFAQNKIDIKVMSDWEILRKQVMSKMHARKGTSAPLKTRHNRF